MPSPFFGQEGVTGDFVFDWRPAIDPVIREGSLETRMVGTIETDGYKCALENDGFEFLVDSVLSQFVITQSSASCLFNSVAASPIG